MTHTLDPDSEEDGFLFNLPPKSIERELNKLSLQELLDIALFEENYEEAAKLRDQINSINNET